MIKRRRDYPKELIIGEATYAVRFARKIPGEAATIVGLCDFEDKIIWLRLRQAPKERFKTFCHEILHALGEEWKLPDLTHRLIYAIEEPIARLLLDNAS